MRDRDNGHSGGAGSGRRRIASIDLSRIPRVRSRPTAWGSPTRPAHGIVWKRRVALSSQMVGSTLASCALPPGHFFAVRLSDFTNLLRSGGRRRARRVDVQPAVEGHTRMT